MNSFLRFFLAFSLFHVSCLAGQDKQIDESIIGNQVGKTINKTASNKLSYIKIAFVEKLSCAGVPAAIGSHLFEPYTRIDPPPIIHELGQSTNNGVVTRKVVFRSLQVGEEVNQVYAIITSPEAGGRFPGLLRLHGGMGYADEQGGAGWSKAGYVTLALDEPGIADPKRCPQSSGAWKAMPYEAGQFHANPDGRNSLIFDAVVAELQAFALLRSLPQVDAEKCGVTGGSWGGYSTLMLCGLLGDKVKAAYSIFGSGFFDKGSFFLSKLNQMPADERENWLRDLDAGRRLNGVTCPIFLAAAVKDNYFYPPAVMATMNSLKADKGLLFAPIKSHSLEGVPEAKWQMQKIHFDYYLKGQGSPLPTATILSTFVRPDGSVTVIFHLSSAFPAIRGKLYYSPSGPAWPDRVWIEVNAQPEADGNFSASLPEKAFEQKLDWYVTATDNRPASASSFVYTAQDSADAFQGGELIPAEDSRILKVGRWLSPGDGSLSASWSASYARVRFTGKRLALDLASPCRIDVRVDDGKVTSIDAKRGLWEVVTNLQEGEHEACFALSKWRNTNSLVLHGVVLDYGEKLLPPPPRRKLIEFIGDSISAGTFQNYAWLTAEKLGCDHSQIAIAGIGLLDGRPNYVSPTTGMAWQYFKATSDLSRRDVPDWDFSRDKPDLIAINLGTNDDSKGVKDADFGEGLADFIRKIHAKRPGVPIIVLEPFGVFRKNGDGRIWTRFLEEGIANAVRKCNVNGDANVHICSTHGWLTATTAAPLLGDNAHPNESGNQILAAKLAEALQQYFQFR